jgi:hypothetical protein
MRTHSHMITPPQFNPTMLLDEIYRSPREEREQEEKDAILERLEKLEERVKELEQDKKRCNFNPEA